MGAEDWPYEPAAARDAAAAADASADRADAVTIRTVPYFAWANRGSGAMRVWIPRDAGAGDAG